MIGDMYLMDINNIEKLISLKQEGSYWDFKREWYSQDKKADLLHDIICMANNLSIETPILLLALMRKMIIHFPL